MICMFCMPPSFKDFDWRLPHNTQCAICLRQGVERCLTVVFPWQLNAVLVESNEQVHLSAWYAGMTGQIRSTPRQRAGIIPHRRHGGTTDFDEGPDSWGIRGRLHHETTAVDFRLRFTR
jgi:hypothetical protein